MHRPILTAVATLVLLAPMTGCYTMQHRVGLGAQGTEAVEKRQWFAFWGLLPVGKVDSQELAGGAANYDVQSQASALDVIMNIFTGYITFYSRTITVTK
jgi:hypothetical protein